MDISNKVAVVTPSILKDIKQLKRCVESVKNQTYNNIEHFIIVDGYHDSTKYNRISDYLYYNNVKLYFTEEPRSNTWGAYPRQWFLDRIASYLKGEHEYIVHLDDDNYLFPEYVEEMVAAIEGSSVDAAICKIYHHGPVSPRFFSDYQAINTEDDVVCIVKGDPPVLQNIDTLNVMVKTEKMLEHGWVCKVGEEGYCNDGDTFEPLFKKIDYVHVDKILGIHY